MSASSPLVDFTVALVANTFAGLAVAAVAYFYIERRLRLSQAREHRVEITRDILEAVRDELKHNRELAASMREALPQGSLPYVGFELNCWTLVSQVPVFTVLDPGTTKSLVDAYVRLRAANDQHRLLFDFMYGPTGTLSYLIAGTSATPEGRLSFRRLEDRRNDLRDRLLRRVEELEPYVETALSQVEEGLLAGAG